MTETRYQLIKGATLNVIDFGATGNGVTDDTTAIQAAFDAVASGGVLLFPEGTYIITDACELLTPTGDYSFRGENATIKGTAAALTTYMFNLKTNGKNFKMEGITFNGNSKARRLVYVEERNQDLCNILIRDCVFKNSYMDILTAEENTGMYLRGGWDKVTIDNCRFTDHTRQAAAGTPGSQGTAGCIVDTYSTYIPRFTTIQNCHFENILNGDTGSDANNVDTDGLKIFGGNTAGEEYILSSAIISNNYFRNCKGRSIKIQNDETTVIGNVFARDILPIASGFAEVNLQISSGEVSSNKFHYDETSLSKSPFHEDGDATADSSIITFYSGAADSRPALITVSDNSIYNNVDPTVGVIQTVIDNSVGAGTYDYDRTLSASGNKATGKAEQFISTTPQVSDDGKFSVIATNNYISELTDSFIGVNNGGNYDKNFFSLTNNIHTASVVPAVYYSTQPPLAQYSITGCIGMIDNTQGSTITGVAGTEEWLQRWTGRQPVSGVNCLSPLEEQYGGLVTILSAELEDDETWTPPKRGYTGYGCVRILSVNWNNTTSAIFTDGSTDSAPTDFGSGSDVVFIDEGGAETDGKVNIWRDTTDETLGIKNRLGDKRVFTLVSIG